MASRKLSDLHPVLAEKAKGLIALASEAGCPILITCTLRSMAEQAGLYAQGRTKPGKRVTNARAGYSWHNFGLAFDTVFITGKGVTYAGPWAKLGHLGRSLGLTWGGDWKKFRDRPHFQFTGGLTLAQARAGKRPT